ncbi:MAG TPA: peptidase S9 [Planctomycetaceae bacterium]|nr:peptidase S9 [Planctomycetaceae bacterium]
MNVTLTSSRFLRVISCTVLGVALIGMTQRTTHADESSRLTPEKLWELSRIGGASISPDGKSLAYTVTRYDLAENSGLTTLYLQPLSLEADPDASEKAVAFDTPLVTADAVALLEDVKGLGEVSWLNHSSGAKLVYVAPTEGEDGTSQAWMIEPSAGSEAVQLTEVEDGIANLIASPSGDKIAFTVDVKLDKTVNEIFEDLPKADARIIDSLMYRHWDAWHDYAYSHVHVVAIDDEGNAGDPVDTMKSMKADCPVPPFGGSEQFAFSPDGQEIALTLKLVNNPAESTDTGVYTYSLEGDGSGELTNMTPGMPGYDMEPRYSPDGRYLAFHSMQRGGFESDRNRIMIIDRSGGGMREVTSGLDQTAHNATWAPDSQSLVFYSETRGTQQVYRIGVEDSQLKQISSGRFDFSVIATIPDSQQVLVRQQSMLRPTELAIVGADSGSVTTITDVNGAIYEDLELPSVEERFFTATDGKQIHNWVILPPEYDADSDQQWPMLTYCQGGPQGQIGQWFSYRWNFHLMASKGYVVLAVNRRGLPGFGREWNDQISGDWGGQAMQDILASTDGMLANPRIDRKRVAAIGASFGGYTVYWLMGNAENRFCSMIAHCGVFNLESMYGSTEELFFVNWDLGGPYWKSADIAKKYDQFSPHNYIGNWKTPLLVIHGEKDFRVPVTQGMEAFTAAQVQGVPSRFLYFPEEGHWVLSPQNGVVWGRVFFDWLDRYCK